MQHTTRRVLPASVRRRRCFSLENIDLFFFVSSVSVFFFLFAMA